MGTEYPAPRGDAVVEDDSMDIEDRLMAIKKASDSGEGHGHTDPEKSELAAFALMVVRHHKVYGHASGREDALGSMRHHISVLDDGLAGSS